MITNLVGPLKGNFPYVYNLQTFLSSDWATPHSDWAQSGTFLLCTIYIYPKLGWNLVYVSLDNSM